MGYKRIVKLKSKIARLKEKNKQLRKERDMYKRMHEIGLRGGGNRTFGADADDESGL